MRPPTKTPNLTLRVTPGTWRTLEQIAQARHRRAYDVGRDALKQYIDGYRKAS